MSEVNIHQIAARNKELKADIALGDAVMRLYKNPDFQLVIQEGFFLHEAARYAQASGDPALNAVQRQDALNIAQASGHLKRFLSVLIQKANQADYDLKQGEATIDEMRSEGAE